MKTETATGAAKPQPRNVKGCGQAPEAGLERILPPEGAYPASPLISDPRPPDPWGNKLFAASVSVIFAAPAPETHTCVCCWTSPSSECVSPHAGLCLGCSGPLYPATLSFLPGPSEGSPESLLEPSTRSASQSNSFSLTSLKEEKSPPNCQRVMCGGQWGGGQSLGEGPDLPCGCEGRQGAGVASWEHSTAVRGKGRGGSTEGPTGWRCLERYWLRTPGEPHPTLSQNCARAGKGEGGCRGQEGGRPQGPEAPVLQPQPRSERWP